MRSFFFCFLLSFFGLSQQGEVLVIGNHERVCFNNCPNVDISDSLPKTLENYNAILLFSNSTSQLKENQIDQLTSFVENGGGLYTGAENWPMQAEANQITNHIFNKESYGNFSEEVAEVNEIPGNLDLKEIESIPPGTTTVAFPLDYRLCVEVWLNDQALILSGTIGKGRIIIDGGYSRFYCDQRTDVTDVLLYKILMYLLGE